jgi:transcriptional regulator with XRE-family HTH domain
LDLKKKEAVSGVVGDLLEGIAGRMEDVAKEAGVSYSALYSWATGRRRPGRRNLEKLASLAEQRVSELEDVAAELRSRLGNGSRSGSGG